MASALICDRCGKVYREAQVANNKFTLFSGEKKENKLSDYVCNGVRIGEPLDLCDTCQFSLERWFDSERGEQN